MTILGLLAGLVLLAVGGEVLVRGAVASARHMGISPLLAGLVIVGFGTSTPELVTSLFAAFEGAPGIAVGNVVGSNIANVLLILGASALLLPLAVDRSAFRRDGIALVVSAAACTAAVMVGTLSRPVGAGLLLLLLIYLVWAYASEKAPEPERAMREHMAEDAGGVVRSDTHSGPGLALSLAMAAAGIAVTIVGARLLVDAAIILAASMGISETVIGLTVVAVGTSLPELAACLVAVWRRHPDVVIGNIVGSNIYNVLGILGVTALVHPIDVPPAIMRIDIWVLAGTTLALVAALRTGWRLNRIEGAAFLALYALYLAFLVA